MLNFENLDNVITNTFVLMILVLIDFVIREAQMLDIMYLVFVIYNFIVFLCMRFDIKFR